MREDYMVKCKDLKPHLKKMTMEIQVASREEVKTIRSKRDRTPHRMAEAVVGDDTGTVIMTLWDENVDQMAAGKTYLITNSYITLFRGSMRLNVGKYGEIKEIEAKFKVNLDNDMSERIFQEARRTNEYDKFSSGSFWPDH